MPTLTLEYRDDSERRALEPAIASVRPLRQVALSAPAGSALAPWAHRAPQGGRALLRTTLTAAWGSRLAAEEPKGGRRGRARRRTPDAPRDALSPSPAPDGLWPKWRAGTWVTTPSADGATPPPPQRRPAATSAPRPRPSPRPSATWRCTARRARSIPGRAAAPSRSASLPVASGANRPRRPRGTSAPCPRRRSAAWRPLSRKPLASASAGRPRPSVWN